MCPTRFESIIYYGRSLNSSYYTVVLGPVRTGWAIIVVMYWNTLCVVIIIIRSFSFLFLFFFFFETVKLSNNLTQRIYHRHRSESHENRIAYRVSKTNHLQRPPFWMCLWCFPRFFTYRNISFVYLPPKYSNLPVNGLFILI